MFLSVITIRIHYGWIDTEEMLIPKTIGEEHTTYSNIKKLDKRLPTGIDPMAIILD